MNERAAERLREQGNGLITLWRKQLAQDWSGYDQVDSERQKIQADAFHRLAKGDDLEAVCKEMRQRWISYAAEWNKKVEAAPKIRRGPMSGHSAIHYKYCDSGRIEGSIIFVRNLYKTILESTP